MDIVQQVYESASHFTGGVFLFKTILFIIVLSILVFVHEFGHYFFARLNGVKAKEFSIGFGKELFGRTDKNGTRWKFCLIPLGGYVSLLGESDTVPKNEQKFAFYKKSPWRRFAIVFGGPLFNFIFAAILIYISMVTVGVDEPKLDKPILGEVIKGSVAENAGFKKGDKLISINGQKLNEWMDIIKVVAPLADVRSEFIVDRNGEILKIFATPKAQDKINEYGKAEGKAGKIGVKVPVEKLNYSLISAIPESFKATYNYTKYMVNGIVMLVSGDIPTSQVGSVISIADTGGDIANVAGFKGLVMFMVFISINLGLLNLLPIPILDGGRLLFLFIEGVTKKTIPEKIETRAFQIGLGLLVFLMVFAISNDVSRLFENKSKDVKQVYNTDNKVVKTNN